MRVLMQKYWLFLCIFFIAAGMAHAQGSAPLLDEYPGAYLAVAPFTLSSTYTGALMRVERSSDAVQADVMPDGSNTISLSSLVTNRSDAGAAITLESFAGTNTLYAMVFYDQSGHGNDLAAPNTSRARILMDGGELKKDSYGNPGSWVDPLGPLVEKGYSIKQLHASFNLGDFTAITLAEPYLLIPALDYTNPDQALFNFGPHVGNGGANTHLLFVIDGHYKRTNLLLGDGAVSNSLVSRALYLLGYPSVYMMSATNTTIELQANTFIRNSVSNPYTPPSTDWVQPFAGNDGQKSPILSVASAFILYPEYKDQAERDAIVDLLANWYSTKEIVGAHADALLPQYKQDYVTLYDWLDTLSESDFDVPQDSSAKITYSPAGATVRDLYGVYWGFQGTQPVTDFLRYPSSSFVLDNGAGRELRETDRTFAYFGAPPETRGRIWRALSFVLSTKRVFPIRIINTRVWPTDL